MGVGSSLPLLDEESSMSFPEGPSSLQYPDRRQPFVQVSTQDIYAMKVLNRKKMKASHLRYAITERNVLAYIRHPFIVQLYFSFQTETRLVLVLHYCSGGDVQGLLNR